MATRKKTESTTVRASVSRERRLALALRALLDGLEDVEMTAREGTNLEAVTEAEQSAMELLTEFGHGDVESIPRRVATVNDAITKAVAAGDGAELSRLGAELARAKAGKPPLAEKSNAATKD